MSLQTTITIPGGLSVSSAVCKIIRAGWYPAQVNLELGVFKDLAASQAEEPEPITTLRYVWNGYDKAAAENAHSQAYTWLKTLPAFAGATDV